MTEQEQRALKRMESKIGTLTTAVEKLTPIVERMNRALVGDDLYGDTGLITEHRDLEKRVDAIEETVEELKAVGGLLKFASNKLPALGFGVMLLYLFSGGDLGSVAQFILGVLR